MVSTARVRKNLLQLAVKEPEVLRLIGEGSVKNGADMLTLRQINALIRSTRAPRKNAGKGCKPR